MWILIEPMKDTIIGINFYEWALLKVIVGALLVFKGVFFLLFGEYNSHYVYSN